MEDYYEEEELEQKEKKRQINIFWKTFWITLLVLGTLIIGFFSAWGLFPLFR